MGSADDLRVYLVYDSVTEDYWYPKSWSHRWQMTRLWRQPNHPKLAWQHAHPGQKFNKQTRFVIHAFSLRREEEWDPSYATS